MKIQISTKKNYELNIGGKLLSNFQIESEWNGLLLLKSATGEKVIVREFRNTLFTFGGIFNEDELKESEIISYSNGVAKIIDGN